MRTKLRLLTPLIVFAACSCGALLINPEISPEPDGAAWLFANAENLFQSNSYENALKTYQQFLERYPSSSNADIALKRIAAIYANQEKDDLSQAAYQRLTAEHPDSEFVIDAMIEIMMFFHRKGRFKEVILQATNIIEKTDSKTNLSPIYEVLGDTHMSLKSPKEAIFFYQMAGLTEGENIPLKLKTAISQLSVTFNKTR